MQLFHVLKYESLLKTCQYSKSETYLVEDVLNQKDFIDKLFSNERK